MKHIDTLIKDNAELKQQREDIVVGLLGDEQIKKFLINEKLSADLVKEYPMHFLKLQKQLKLCAVCKGLDECKLPNNGHVQSLKYEQILSYVFKPCRYQLQYDNEYKHLKKYRINDLSDETKKVLISDVDIDKESNAKYLKAIYSIAEWLDKPSDKGFYLYGDVGVGKTYLAACIANQFAMNGKSVAFIHMPSFLVKLKEAFYDDDEQERLKNIAKNVDLLVMDDIGAETVTSWYRDEVLLPILNERMDQKRWTVFTSNLSLKTLETNFRYNQKGEIDEMKAVRIMERIKMLADPMVIEGKNRRV